MTEPFRDCPRFEACSCNACPLDPAIATRPVLPGEERCVARRRVRERIAAAHVGVLAGRGLLPRELERDKRRAAWAALPADDPRKLAFARERGLHRWPKKVKATGGTPMAPAASCPTDAPKNAA